ncbi:dimethylhistidine N-methyltransferase [Paucimonas lemoignei]|uniref:Dimethylhistidine N-methyltransferase n=1 Tax=Paucimonas lemoignei TaxID=29443 RepID=A0A4R3HVH3_PAULE|nr:L-histidine N(alpha)-methyltransferase [Paucimonas lemoignei]TCS34730.1 dimethylhistidine N-methyltransferase [Paucimonas lemoignei]
MQKPSGYLPDGFIQVFQQDNAVVRAELLNGLLETEARVAPKFLYDALGSKLFEAICELPEYYPTRTEAEIFARHLPDMAKAIGTGVTLVDLGAGNCAKAARLFDTLAPRQYVPVDISVEFLRDAVAQLKCRYPDLPITGIGMDFSSGLDLPEVVNAEHRLFFYPGSSIGNFTPAEALAFLRRIHHACGAGQVGGLLIGVDLVKEKRLLDAAYDDALGVTAAFNLNLLHHMNVLIGADFNLRDWRHRGFFNAAESRVEMHLEARRDVIVSWPDGRRRFVEGERIHTESSYKYTRDGFREMLQEAGFAAPRIWTDERGWFMVCYAPATH